LVGTWRLIRFNLRRDRIRLAVWIVLLVLVPVATANAIATLYPDEAARQQLATTVNANPAFLALLGPVYDTSVGGLTAWRIGTIVAFLIGLMAILSVVRHTRDEEETGRQELLAATVLGRHAPLTAALAISIGAGLVIAVLLTAGLVSQGLPLAGSAAYGFGLAAVAATFAGFGAVAAQLTQNASSARSIGVAIVGLSFLLRLAGDAGESNGISWLSWLSPIGWFTQLRPFAGEEWWIFLLWLGLTAILAATAFAISARRDVGAGAFPPRPGPAFAARSLSSAFGLSWRLQRGALLGWLIGLAVLGVVYGAVGDSIGDLLEDTPQIAQIFEQLGGVQGITDVFFSTVVGILALIASAYGIRSVLKLRVEEEASRAEPVLATATRRQPWAASHLIYGLLGPALILLIAGAVAGATYGAIIGDVANQTGRVLEAAAVQLPAVWVLSGAAMALFGLLPEYTGLSWGLLVACLVFGQLGRILQFPQWLLDISPFTHIPLVPAEDLRILPLAILTTIALVLVVAGLAGFRRRDLQTP
jgi:ABC-2 type transport system permease protein